MADDDLKLNTSRRGLPKKHRNSPTHIYVATLRGTTKRYVGITTVRVGTRWADHKSKSKNTKYTRHFYLALRKYGFDAFDWEWLGTLENWAEGCAAERFFIAGGWTHYNKTQGGEGVPGYSDGFLGKHHTEESKEKIRAALIGKPRPQWVKDKMSAACKGRKAHNKGKKMPEGTGDKISAALKGKTTWSKGKKFSPEHCAAISKGKAGKKQSPETIANRTAKTAITVARRKELKQLILAMGPVIKEVLLDG